MSTNNNTSQKTRDNSPRRRFLVPAAVLVGVIAVGAWALNAPGRSESGPGEAGEAAASFAFTNVKAQTKTFMAYNKSISLTADQEKIKLEALTSLPAPCCSDRTAYTCCCSCNMAQSWWGLSKHLIANRGYDAKQVRSTVKQWFEFINPKGFSGDSCYSGGCGRSFEHNGCGGMNENRVIF